MECGSFIGQPDPHDHRDYHTPPGPFWFTEMKEISSRQEDIRGMQAYSRKALLYMGKSKQLTNP